MVPSPSHAPFQTERRLLTVLFCDLVDSTALAARLDPEDLLEVLTSYQQRATEIIQKTGGLVARYEGDGILACFGYPVANEDDAERAVDAGLELAQTINKTSNVSEHLRVRVGIASGVVVVGNLQHSNPANTPSIVGETPNLAARLQKLAEPDTVVIASSTQRLVGGLFEYRKLPSCDLKGFSSPVHPWQVIGRSTGISRFEALRSQLPLVGRDREINLLLQRWEQAKAGAGQIALIVGEAGIGKSRLKLELLSRTSQDFCAVRSYFCSPRHKDSTLHPMLAQLQKAATFHRADSPDAQFKKLEALAAGSGIPSKVLGLLAELMGVSPGGRANTSRLDATRKRKILFQALARGLEQVAQQRPAIITLEDIHWMDPTSRELLETIIPRVATLPVLIVLTSRPTDLPAWHTEPHVSLFELGPVDTRSSQRLIKQIAGAEGLPKQTLMDIAARADGVPLFLEELTKATVESQTAHSDRNEPSLQIPTVPGSLQASLMSRLDRLGPAREVAKQAAIIGREFSFELLCAVTVDHSETELSELLGHLMTAELVLPVSSFPSSTYAFRHALIQDVAYGSLLRQERRQLHERVARALQEQFTDTVSMQPEVLAWHLTKAEHFESAVRYWLEAGNRSAARAAFVEAVDQLSEGIKVCQLLPDCRERARKELDLQLALGPPTMATKGYAAQESLQVYSRAYELAAQCGNSQQHMDVLLGLFNVHYGRAELTQALAVARQNLAIAEGVGALEGRAHTLMGQTHAAMGNFLEAKNAFVRALDVLNLEPEEPRSFEVFGSQQVVSLAFIAGVHFALGEPELAQAATAQSIQRARQLRHPMSTALALVTELLTPIPGGLKADLAMADEAIGFCSQHGLSNFEMWALFARGAIVARRGDPREGIRTMRAAIEAADNMSSLLFRPVQYATVASAHAKLGENKEALKLLEEALRTAERTGEHRADASLHRFYGEVLVAAGQHEVGRREFVRALEVARDQNARAEGQRILKRINAAADLT